MGEEKRVAGKDDLPPLDNEKGETAAAAAAAGGGGCASGARGDNTTQKTVTPDGAEALKKCLEENNGDQNKCKSTIDAFQSSSSSAASSSGKRLAPLMLRSGSLTDV